MESMVTVIEGMKLVITMAPKCTITPTDLSPPDFCTCEESFILIMIGKQVVNIEMNTRMLSQMYNIENGRVTEFPRGMQKEFSMLL